MDLEKRKLFSMQIIAGIGSNSINIVFAYHVHVIITTTWRLLSASGSMYMAWHLKPSFTSIDFLDLNFGYCSGQNKNNTMMAYLLWRVATGRHRKIEMNFLIAGHTKFPCDLYFGYLKKKTRRSRLSSLEDIKNVGTHIICS